MLSSSKRLNHECSAGIVIIVLLTIAGGCGKKHHRTASVPPAPRASQPKPMTAVPLGHVEEGVASWYGHPYHGRPAADGEIYDMEKLVAAHRLLPFNTWLKVTNVANGQTVVVRVIDRGPFVGDRIIDLSKAAARQIGLLGPGIGRVRLEVVAAPADVPSNDFYAVQVGAFSVLANAEHARDQYAQTYGDARLALKQGSVPLWRVLVGKEPSPERAQQLANTIGARGQAVFVVRLDQTILDPAANPPVAAASNQPLPPASEPEQ